MPGYRVINNFRTLKKGGGVSMFIKHNVNFNVRNDLNTPSDIAETVFVEFSKEDTGCDKDIIIAVVYKPPNSDVDMFKDCLNSVLDKIRKENKYSYLLGDYNINLLNVDKHIPTSDFIDSLFAQHYVPLINKPTRVT